MEQGKGKWSSSPPSSPSTPCSIAELFIKKESPAAGIIGLLFPQSKLLGEHSLNPDMIAKSRDYPNHHWSAANREVDSVYKDQPVEQPFYLTSSIFYGGQDDIYTPPKSKQGYGSSSEFKDIGIDDSEFASRGNWWQGSLYY